MKGMPQKSEGLPDRVSALEMPRDWDGVSGGSTSSDTSGLFFR